jgi:hypothetical protein
MKARFEINILVVHCKLISRHAVPLQVNMLCDLNAERYRNIAPYSKEREVRKADCVALSLHSPRYYSWGINVLAKTRNFI